jgi:hypothetical protein
MVLVGGAISLIAMLGFATSSGPVIAAVDVGAAAGSVCTFNVVPNSVSSFPANVHITGTAPGGATVTAFAGATVLASTVADASGQFTSGDFSLTGPTDITVNFTLEGGNGYATGCSTPEGALVVRVEAATAQRAAQAQQGALAFTGSDRAVTFALIGLAAVLIGVVFTIGARRRNRINL